MNALPALIVFTLLRGNMVYKEALELWPLLRRLFLLKLRVRRGEFWGSFFLRDGYDLSHPATSLLQDDSR